MGAVYTNENLKRVSFGVCDIVVTDKDGNDVHLGLTKGGVTLQIEVQGRNLQVDQFGSGSAAVIYTGLDLKLRLNLAETQLKTLERMLPASKLVEEQDGTRRLVLTAPQQVAEGFPIRGTPVETANSQKGFYFPRVCFAPGTIEHAWSAENESVWAVTLQVLPVIGTDGKMTYGEIIEPPQS